MRQILTEIRQDLDGLKAKYEKNTKEVNKSLIGLEQSSIPNGFVYVQYPHNKEPNNLWPHLKWNEITSDYSGAFFRARGGKARVDDGIQEASAPRLVDVKSFAEMSHGSTGTINIPKGWSNAIFVGNQYVSTRSGSIYLKFGMSNPEIRPINMSIRIWICQGPI